jgi:hypothetical protein
LAVAVVASAPSAQSQEVIMTCSKDIAPKLIPSAKTVTGCALCALFALGTLATLAYADEHHGWHGDRHGYYGGYYGAPPVVYGPGIGINLPGIAIGIH